MSLQNLKKWLGLPDNLLGNGPSEITKTQILDTFFNSETYKNLDQELQQVGDKRLSHFKTNKMKPVDEQNVSVTVKNTV